VKPFITHPKVADGRTKDGGSPAKGAAAVEYSMGLEAQEQV
jgi:hypothetical protein